mmetsp:Transcript_11294/g.25715  ORF Transcript_11294/g.25715 Transcript_11294/m.25715 type:complete len:324 (-) Transcript_11294:52-1023(-)
MRVSVVTRLSLLILCFVARQAFVVPKPPSVARFGKQETARPNRVGIVSNHATAEFPADFLIVPESRKQGPLSVSRALLFAVTLFTTASVLIVAMLAALPWVKKKDPVRRRFMDKVNMLWAWVAAGPFFRVKVKSAENLPPDDVPFVYVANHQSFLDIFSMYFLRRPFKWVSKASILKIPVIGWAMSLTGHLSLERNDRKSQLMVMRQCGETLQSGASMFFFPEGTRTKTGVMGTFKRGAFSIAQRAGVGIVPITVLGTGAIMPSGKETSLFPTREGVQLVCHPAISAEEVQESSQSELLAKVRDMIASALPPELRGTPQPASD